MTSLLQRTGLIMGLIFSTMRVTASPDIDTMSDMEVTEYAIRYYEVVQSIEKHQLCQNGDISCIRAQFQLNGISYDDKESLQKRLVILLGSIY